jgi:hypothetical protein
MHRRIDITPTGIWIVDWIHFGWRWLAICAAAAAAFAPVSPSVAAVFVAAWLTTVAHELGHFAALRRHHVPMGRRIAVTVGANMVAIDDVTVLADQPAVVRRRVALAGPAAGTAAALVALFVVVAAAPGAHVAQVLLVWFGVGVNVGQLVPFRTKSGGSDGWLAWRFDPHT